MSSLQIVPLSLNNEPGIWQDLATFKRGILKLNDGRSCEVAIRYEREQRTALSGDLKRITAERDQARSDLIFTNEAREKDQKAASKNIADLNLQIQTQQTKHLRGTLRLIGIGVTVIAGVWGLTKVGIL